MTQRRDIIEKASLIRKTELDPNDLDTDCWFPEFESISIKDLKQYQKKYPFLPDSYLRFLSEFSGARISWLKILSFNDPERLTISDSLESLKEAWDYSNGFLPFAEHGGGIIYCFDQDGKIWSFELGLYDEKPEFIANSFEEFIDECLLGKRYKEFYDSEDEEDEFYDFLKKQGWV